MNFDTLNFIDKNGNQLQLGDTIKVSSGRYKNYELTFVFCIPQHRYGFQIRYDEFVRNIPEKLVEPFVLDYPNLHFYYTPSNVKIISKI